MDSKKKKKINLDRKVAKLPTKAKLKAEQQKIIKLKAFD